MIKPAARQPIRLLLVSPHSADARRIARLLPPPRMRLRRAPTIRQAMAALRSGAGDVLLCDADAWSRRPADAVDGLGPVILLTERDGGPDGAGLDGSVVDRLRRDQLDAARLELSLRYALRSAPAGRGRADSRDEFNLFFRQAPCAICIFGADGKIRFSNELFRSRLRNLPPEPRPRDTPPGLPWKHFDGERHWLVTSFEIPDRGAGVRRGLAAFDIGARVDLEVSRERESQLLAALVRRLPIVVGRVDRQRIVEASGEPGLARGFSADRLVGQSLAKLHPEARDAIRRALAGHPADCVIEGRAKDGPWHAEMFVFPDPNEPGTAVFFARDITARRRLESRLLSISDAEQRRLGADLHDGLGPHLTGTACLAAALRDKLAAAGSAYSPEAATVAVLVDTAIEMSRALAHGLCPVQVEKRGLSAALEELTFRVQRLSGIACHVDLSKAPPLIAYADPETANHLYRIVQEAVSNALRHARARRILVTLGSIEGRPYVAVDDDGKGFDLRRLAREGGVGLQLMAYRAAMIGGVFRTLRSRLGGARVECVLAHPLRRRNAAARTAASRRLNPARSQLSELDAPMLGI